MERYVARQNIDHYLGMLDDSGLDGSQRDTVNRLLMWEEDKLGTLQESLSYAEGKLLDCEQRVRKLVALRDGFAVDTREWELAGQVLANFRTTVNIVWKWCQRLRLEIARSPI